MDYPAKFEKQFDRVMPYLSWTRFSSFKKDPYWFYRSYILGEKETNERMVFGKRFAKSRETGERVGDMGLDLACLSLPSFKEKEYDLEVKCSEILLKSKFDSFDPETLELCEDKTGSRWTQGMVDKHEQLTFYSTAIWLKWKKLPPRIILNWVKTKQGESGRESTGDYKTFETKRTINDVINFIPELLSTWSQIKKMAYEESWLSE